MKKKIKYLCLVFISIILFSFYDVCLAFELDIKGSTGWATANISLYSGPSSDSAISTVIAGKPFKILSENGSYFEIEYDGIVGYVNSDYCMINLPDVIPSIIYNITNTESSIFVSSGYALPGITGERLYSGSKVMNYKIGREEYICPALYSTAKMIYSAQQMALKDGYTLKIYDLYRPRSIGDLLWEKFNILYDNNAEVRSNVDYSTGLDGTRYYWGKGWFLARSLSSHNTGSSVDLTLVDLSTNQEVVMPTNMHELSSLAIKYYNGSVSRVPANYSVGMLNNPYAQKLDYYMTSVGMTTLASEWWHFQDQTGYERIKSLTYSNGCDFQVDSILSERDKVEPVKHTIYYKDGNNTYTEEYKAGDYVLLKTDIVKEGYKLIGWNYQDEIYGEYDFIVMPDNDIELIAEWELDVPKINNYEILDNYQIDIPVNTNINNLNLGISNIYNIKVYNSNYIEKTSGLIGTNDKIKIYLNNISVCEYTVFVSGDTNGDGKISVSDISKMYRYLKKKITFDEIFVKAGNVNGDNHISVSDIAKLYKVLKGKMNLS